MIFFTPNKDAAKDTAVLGPRLNFMSGSRPSPKKLGAQELFPPAWPATKGAVQCKKDAAKEGMDVQEKVAINLYVVSYFSSFFTRKRNTVKCRTQSRGICVHASVLSYAV